MIKVEVKNGSPYIDGRLCSYETSEIRSMILEFAEVNDVFILPNKYDFVVTELNGFAKIINKYKPIKNLPQKIYLQIGSDVTLYNIKDDWNDLYKGAITWSDQRINSNDIEYSLFNNDSTNQITDDETTLVETINNNEPTIIEINKDHLIELYNFAYEQALETGKVDELKMIDLKMNGG